MCTETSFPVVNTSLAYSRGMNEWIQEGTTAKFITQTINYKQINIE
jgi:hypothetical protein